MDENECRRRQEFLALTEQDSRRVQALRPIFAEHARTFAERFYQHLLDNPHTASLLRDPEQLEQLKNVQIKYFAELLEGIFDQTYFAGRLCVGRTHQRVGLEPVWYLGAYNQYIQIAFPLFAQAFGDNLQKVLPSLLSLVKVIFLDIGLALDTYFQEATEQLRIRNQELQKALSLYWKAQHREEQLRKLASHEIRGGLAAMITSLEDLLDQAGTTLDPDIVEQLETVTHRCWSMSNLLKEMLSPTDGGGPAWVETAPIFENLITRFGLYAEGRSVHFQLPEHAPRVWADPLQLREVFANLVSNAVRYLDKEPGRVEITCQPDGEFYRFGVADNGPGIPESIRERIFEPFVRGPSARTRTQGTGLGLYFVRTVIEQGSGRVWVESTPGQGSRFWFTVPRVQPLTEARSLAGPASPTGGSHCD